MELKTPPEVLQLVATKKELRMKAAVYRHAREALDELAAAYAQGSVRETRKLTYRLATQHRMKVWGLMKKGFHWCSVESLNQMANELNLAAPFEDEIVSYHEEPKNGAGTRTICKLPLELGACHYVIGAIVEAQTRMIPNIYHRAGRGRNKLIEDTLTRINDGHSYVSVLDIKDCFASVQPALLDTLPIHQRFVTKTLRVENIIFQPRRNEKGGIPEATTYYETSYRNDAGANTSAPTGLMQGSPASVPILSWMYKDMPQFDTEMGIALIYVDDILVVSRTEHGRREIKDAVVRYLTDCPGGPLQLETRDIPPRASFDLLGYRIEYGPDGHAYACLSEQTLERLEKKLPIKACRDWRSGLSRPSSAIQHLHAVMNGHPLAVDREAYEELYLSFLNDHEIWWDDLP